LKIKIYIELEGQEVEGQEVVRNFRAGLP